MAEGGDQVRTGEGGVTAQSLRGGMHAIPAVASHSPRWSYTWSWAVESSPWGQRDLRPQSLSQACRWVARLGWILAPGDTGAVVLNRMLLGVVPSSSPAALVVTVVTSLPLVVTLLLTSVGELSGALFSYPDAMGGRLSVTSKGLVLLLARSGDLGIISWASQLLLVTHGWLEQQGI